MKILLVDNGAPLFELRDPFRGDINPHRTRYVAELVFLVDRRPAYMYEECGKLNGELHEAQDRFTRMLGQIERGEPIWDLTRHMTATPAPKPEKQTAKHKPGTRVCEECGDPVAGNRVKTCHRCSRKHWEGDAGKGGRLVAEMETRFHQQRERDIQEFELRLAELRAERIADVGKWRRRATEASTRAQRAESAQFFQKLLERLAAEEPDAQVRAKLLAQMAKAKNLVEQGWRRRRR